MCVCMPAHAGLQARVRLWKHPEEEEVWGAQWGQEDIESGGWAVAGRGWKDGRPGWGTDDCSRGWIISAKSIDCNRAHGNGKGDCSSQEWIKSPRGEGRAIGIY